MVAATTVDVVQPRQVVDELVLAYNAESDEFDMVDDTPVLKGIDVTIMELVVLAYNAETDEFAVVGDAAVLKGIEVIITVLVLFDTSTAVELVAFCIVVLTNEEVVELENITLVVSAAAGTTVELVMF